MSDTRTKDPLCPHGRRTTDCAPCMANARMEVELYGKRTSEQRNESGTPRGEAGDRAGPQVSPPTPLTSDLNNIAADITTSVGDLPEPGRVRGNTPGNRTSDQKVEELLAKAKPAPMWGETPLTSNPLSSRLREHSNFLWVSLRTEWAGPMAIDLAQAADEIDRLRAADVAAPVASNPQRDIVEELRRPWEYAPSGHRRAWVEQQAADEIERLRGLLGLARAYVHANQGGWCRDGITSDEVLKRTADVAAPAPNPWVSCSERLPQMRYRVLVFSPEKAGGRTVLHVNEAMRVEIEGGWTWDHGVPPDYVTHWGHVHEVIKGYPEPYGTTDVANDARS